jgi:capsid protein
LPSIQTARDLYEITRSKTKQIKDVNSIVGYVSKQQQTAGLAGLESFEGEIVPSSPAEGVAEDGDDAANKTSTSARKIELKPGTFIELEPGEKLETLMSQYQASDYKELVMLMLHAMSSPVGLPVELWFSGLGDVNYSGFKGLGVQWNARRRYIIDLLKDRGWNRLQFWRISLAKLYGEITVINPDNDEDLIDWAFKRTPVLDDEKHAKAVEVQVNSGEKTVVDFWEEDGIYAEEEFERRRQIWIAANIAAGNIDDTTDLKTVKVPLEFLLKNQIPGVKPVVTQTTDNKDNQNAEDDQAQTGR